MYQDRKRPFLEECLEALLVCVLIPFAIGYVVAEWLAGGHRR